MAKITSIKERINQLDAGSFQILCDAYLSKEGYPNLVALGTMSGTTKTTKGTPDTYFCISNGNYIFAEYTTQKNNLVKKIYADLEKCLDSEYTGISTDKIIEIVYCHTSSNITPKDDADLKQICKDLNVKLTLIGIDKLANDLFVKYPSIIRDYLNLSVDTQQIQSFDDFIHQYDANTLVAPLQTKFMFRKQELQSIDIAFQTHNIVLLSGPAGIGKTRLALEYANNRTLQTKETFYCIHNRSMPLYQDLIIFFEKPGDYFIFIDDANQLSELQHIVEYVNKSSDGYNVKILISVRDYAIQKVKSEICEISTYETIAIKLLSDEEICSIVNEYFGITNNKYLDRIARISEGNCRIAMLAGKVASETNRLDSLDDVTTLYTNYYGKALNDAELVTNKSLLIVAGIMSFLNTVRFDHIEQLLPLLEELNINQEAFMEAIYQLHIKEIVNIYHDMVVVFSEQCFANYILKYIFIDTKLISLSKTIKFGFLISRQRTIHAVSTLLNVFRNDSLYAFVKSEILTVWNQLCDEKSPDFYEYMKAFYAVNQSETLLILKSIIDDMEAIDIKPEKIDRKTGRNYQNVDNDILTILGGFADTELLDSALDLFFIFYQKHPDLYIKFYHAIITYYSVQNQSRDCNFYTQITLLNKFIEYSNNWENKYVTLLYIDITSKFSKLTFSYTEASRNNKSFIMNQLSLNYSESACQYRKIMWTNLSKIATFSCYKAEILDIFKNYGHGINESNNKIIEFDKKFICDIMLASFKTDELKPCLIASHIRDIFDNAGCSTESLDTFVDSPKMQLYNLLIGPKWNLEISYEERERITEHNIKEYVENSMDLKNTFDLLFNIYLEYINIDHSDSYNIARGIHTVLQMLKNDKESYIYSVYRIIASENIEGITPASIICDLFELFDAEQIFRLIASAPLPTNNYWMYSYFSELPQKYVNEKQLEKLYEFLRSDSDKFITNSPYRNILSFKKFLCIDRDVIVTSSKIILEKKHYSPFIVGIYFHLLFNKHIEEPKNVIALFADDIKLLETIYLCLNHAHIDYDGEYLYEICLFDSEFLTDFADWLVEDNNYNKLSEIEPKCSVFYKHNNYIENIDVIINEAFSKCKISNLYMPKILQSFLPLKESPQYRNKVDAWIKHFIELNCFDSVKIRCLFDALSQIDLNLLTTHLRLFINLNSDFELFKQLPLTPTSYSWSGSAVPLYSSWIDHLEGVLSLCHGIKFIEHRKLIEDNIASLREQIKHEEIRDILIN